MLHLFLIRLHHYRKNILIDIISALNICFAPLVGIFAIFVRFAIFVSSAKDAMLGLLSKVSFRFPTPPSF